MGEKVKLNFWVEQDTARAIRRYAEGAGRSLTETVESFLPRDPWTRALEHASAGQDPGETLYALAARGMTAEMTECSTPVSRELLSVLKPHAIAEEYLRFIDATRHRLGLMGTNGKPSRWKLEPVPGTHEYVIIANR